MKKLFSLVLILLFSSALAVAQNQSKMNARILLIPLDDRPPCWQFPVRMGLIGDAEIVAPPREMLGRFTEFGKSDEIINWLKTQDLKRFDAAIVALDMLAYGGLVASRVAEQTTAESALSRMEILRDLKKRRPQMPLYVQSVIMRLAPTGTGANESYRARLAEWAETSVEADEKSKTRTAQLEREIPAAALSDYKTARRRNLTVNLKAVEMVLDKTIDYLILSQDDAKPRGIHVADRERLIAETRRAKLTDRIAVQPGADEVGMLLLARALNGLHKFSPTVKAVYSSENLSNQVMPYEDKPLRETVSYHIKATGAREVADEKTADLLFYVYASRFEPGRAASFAGEIADQIGRNKRIIVADVDPKGDVQGGDTEFTEQLLKRNLFPQLNGYASWNTAGNTIGTTLPHGVIFALAENKLLKSKNGNSANRIWTAQNWFTFHRVLDDYYYHNPVRAQAKDFIVENKWNAFRLSDEATRKVEDFAGKPMQKAFEELSRELFGAGRRRQGLQQNVTCEKPANLIFDLPWNRTFEADIKFDLQCRAAAPK